VVSLIGDNLDVVTHQPATGTVADRNVHDLIPVKDLAFDKFAILAVEDAVKLSQPGAQVKLFAPTAPELFREQERFFVDRKAALPADLLAGLQKAAATHLLMITKFRAPTQIAIVNQKFAKHYFPNESAVGKRIGQGNRPNTPLNIEIVGVAADSLYEGPREGVHRQVFWPRAGRGSAVVYMRTRTASSNTYDMVRRTVAQVDASMPVYGLRTVESQLDETLLTDRLVAMLSASFGLLATLLASVGLYGVMAFVVARRWKELGIRIALGAEPVRVQWIVMREVLLLLGIGLAVGLPSALWLGKYLSSQLYGIQPRDPAIAAGMIGLLATVSILAGLIPARRAGRIDPIRALRHE